MNEANAKKHLQRRRAEAKCCNQIILGCLVGLCLVTIYTIVMVIVIYFQKIDDGSGTG